MSAGASPVRVLIVNAVALNVGDAAILEGIIQSLRDAYGDGVDVTVADDHPEAAARLYPHIRFVPALHARRRVRGARWKRRLLASLRRRRIGLGVRLLERAPALALGLLDEDARAHVARLRAADVVLSTGGTYLVEHYPLMRRLHELIAAQALGTPTYLMTQSAGPFRRPAVRRAVADVATRTEAVFLRDERSRGHLLDLGVPAAKLFVCADAAFALDAPEVEPARAGHPRVAVSVREWRRFSARGEARGLELYRASVEAAVRALHEVGADVTFVSTCQGVPEYWTDDARFAQQLVADRLADLPRVRVDAGFHRPAELAAMLAGFELVVATRMHFAILALVAGTPVIAIAYEFKTTELLDTLGMRHLARDIDRIEPADFARLAAGAFAERAALRAQVRERVPALRAAAAEPAARIRRRHPTQTGEPS